MAKLDAQWELTDITKGKANISITLSFVTEFGSKGFCVASKPAEEKDGVEILTNHFVEVIKGYMRRCCFSEKDIKKAPPGKYEFIQKLRTIWEEKGYVFGFDPEEMPIIPPGEIREISALLSKALTT
jgi:hypothetical protein